MEESFISLLLEFHWGGGLIRFAFHNLISFLFFPQQLVRAYLGNADFTTRTEICISIPLLYMLDLTPTNRYVIANRPVPEGTQRIYRYILTLNVSLDLTSLLSQTKLILDQSCILMTCVNKEPACKFPPDRRKCF